MLAKSQLVQRVAIPRNEQPGEERRDPLRHRAKLKKEALEGRWRRPWTRHGRLGCTRVRLEAEAHDGKRIEVVQVGDRVIQET